MIKKCEVLTRLHICLACVAALTGCATTREFKSPQPPGHGQAVLYVIRDHFPPFRREAQLIVNGTQLATMADDDYVEVNAPVGIDDILITINGDKPFDFKLPVSQGTMYVVLSGSGSWRPLVFGPPMSVIELTRHVQAVVVSKSQAQAIGKRIHKPIS